MLKISENAALFINKHLQNPDQLLSSDNINDILDPLYDLIDEKGFISQDEGYNAFGREAQKVYDDLYYNN